MLRNLETGTADWQGAVIAINDENGSTFRPAAFVFDTAAGGIAWIEPSYADPAGAASQAFHRRDGERVAWNKVKANGATVIVLAYEPEIDTDMGEALEWFRRHLDEMRTTWQDERERVRQAIASDLA